MPRRGRRHRLYHGGGRRSQLRRLRQSLRQLDFELLRGQMRLSPGRRYLLRVGCRRGLHPGVRRRLQLRHLWQRLRGGPADLHGGRLRMSSDGTGDLHLRRRRPDVRQHRERSDELRGVRLPMRQRSFVQLRNVRLRLRGCALRSRWRRWRARRWRCGLHEPRRGPQLWWLRRRLHRDVWRGCGLCLWNLQVSESSRRQLPRRWDESAAAMVSGAREE